MSSSFMVWAGMTVLGLWAAGVTWVHLVYRRQVKTLAHLPTPGGAHTSSLSTSHPKSALVTLKQRMAELLAAHQTLEEQIQAMDSTLEKKDKELMQHKEESRQMVQNARVTGKRIMMNASKTLDKGVRSTRQVIDCLDTIIKDAGKGASDQRTMVQDAASAMEEINASIAQMNENARQASDAAKQARQKSETGALLVGQTKDRIDEVAAETARLETVLSRLGKRTGEIGEVINLISDIADQTNLLALNAAIEAARAGERGRGFAVVADEVRKLAEKTMDATREVNDRISGIQEGVTATVASTTKTTSLVDNARKLAEESNQVLEHLAQLSSHSHVQVESIATAISQQAAASEEITRTMVMVDDVSTKTAKEMTQAADAMQQLLVHADAMSDLLGVFALLGQGNLQETMQEVVVAPEIIKGTRPQREAYLRKIVEDNACMELMYLTDAQGIQCIANIPRPGRQSPQDAQAHGRNWSDRPWFQSAIQAKGLVVSPVYESVATGKPCVTISSVVMHGSNMVGVVAADVALGQPTETTGNLPSSPKDPGA